MSRTDNAATMRRLARAAKKDDELTRLAFLYGEDSRRGYADCWPVGSKEWKSAMKLANRMKEYRLKRWGRTALEAVTANCPLVSVMDLRKEAGK